MLSFAAPHCLLSISSSQKSCDDHREQQGASCISSSRQTLLPRNEFFRRNLFISRRLPWFSTGGCIFIRGISTKGRTNTYTYTSENLYLSFDKMDFFYRLWEFYRSFLSFSSVRTFRAICIFCTFLYFGRCIQTVWSNENDTDTETKKIRFRKCRNWSEL